MKTPVDSPEKLLTPGGGYEVSASLADRQRQLDETTRALTVISNWAGKDIEVIEAASPLDISPEPGVYVLGGLLEEGVEVEDAEFDLSRELLSGIADSAHSVVTGKLGVTFSDGTKKEVKVAAKRSAKRDFEDRYKRTLREVQVMEEAREKGDIGFEPVAVIVAPDTHPLIGEVVLVSLFSPDVMSLDNYPWGRGPDLRNMDTATAAASAVGRFNVKYQKVHGDAKIKNVAVEEGNGFGMIDFETSEPFDINDPFACSVAAVKDFGLFIDSLEKKGFFNKVRTPGELEGVLGRLADAYLSPWSSHPSSEAQDKVYTEVAHICTQITEKRFPGN